MQVTNSTNYNTNFGALVPKAEYSGKPRLRRFAIAGIKRAQFLIKEADRDIMDMENQISQLNGMRALKKYLKERIAIVKAYKTDLLNEIDMIKLNNRCSFKRLFAMRKERLYDTECLDSLFDEARL